MQIILNKTVETNILAFDVSKKILKTVIFVLRIS